MHNNKSSGDEEKTEPKENDKWVENNDHDKDSEMNPKNSRLDELRGRAKKFASNKYHLIIVLLCIILFILFLIVIVLAVQLGTYTCPESNDCRSSECLSAAATVVARSDQSFDPCNDFWLYSCGGWASSNPFPKNRGSFSVIDEVKHDIYNRIRYTIDLVDRFPLLDPNSHKWKVKAFYDACMGLNDIEYWVPGKIKQAIHDLGGWAVIKDPPGGGWNRNDVLKRLQVRFGVSAFFKLIVEPDDLNPVKNIIKLIPSGLGLPSRHYYFKPPEDLYVKSYKEFIKNTVLEMGVTFTEANRLAEEVFNYEKRLAEVTPSPEMFRDTKGLYMKLTVNELDRMSASISWTNLLQTYFPEVVLPQTEVAILSEKYFRDISAIISSTDNSVLNNYYMWRFLHTYAPHSSSKFRIVANHFKQILEGGGDVNSKYQDNWEFCIDVTTQYLGHAVGAMYISHFFPREQNEQIQIYLHKLASALSSVINDIPWINDQEVREAALLKVRTVLLLSGYPNFAKNHGVDNYYKELKVQTDYFENIRDGIYFSHKKQEEMLRNNSLTDYSWTVFPHDVYADYKYSGNQLVVPAGLFENPLFDFGSPLAVKYGVLAAHVANKLGELFDDKGINYDAYGVLKPWISNETAMSFKQKEECLKTTVANYSLHDVVAPPDLVIGSTIADIGGVKLAYKAYMRHAREAAETGELPGLDINNRQLFFISYAQSLCQIITLEKLRSFREANTHLPDKLRVLSTLQQLPEFSEAFSCPSSSFMNSQKYCHVW